MSGKQREEILKRGVFLVKNVIPKEETEAFKEDVHNFVKENSNTSGFPKENPVVFELYWSKRQIVTRSHPNLRKTTRFANKLWHASSETEVCLDQNISYADRLSMRYPGDNQFSLGPHADLVALWKDRKILSTINAMNRSFKDVGKNMSHFMQPIELVSI